MNAKRKGARNEHRSIRLLEDAGYRCTRAAASLGAWDIIGIGATDVILVQVKTNAWPGSVEMETLRLFSAPANCRKLVHRWRARQRKPDVRELGDITETISDGIVSRNADCRALDVPARAFGSAEVSEIGTAVRERRAR